MDQQTDDQVNKEAVTKQGKYETKPYTPEVREGNIMEGQHGRTNLGVPCIPLQPGRVDWQGKERKHIRSNGEQQREPQQHSGVNLGAKRWIKNP